MKTNHQDPTSKDTILNGGLVLFGIGWALVAALQAAPAAGSGAAQSMRAHTVSTPAADMGLAGNAARGRASPRV